MGASYATATKAVISAQILGNFVFQDCVDDEEFIEAPDVKVVPGCEQNANTDFVSSSWRLVGVEMQEFFGRLFFIADLGNLNLHLNRNLPVSLANSEGMVTAYSNDIDEFGTGTNENEAIEDLKKSIVEIYYLYKDEQNNLGPLPRQQWSFLKSVITES
ncbi:MAG TPA: hypothetical protein ENH23_03365 [candidate division Zixibacteria bacterium]|nr:hypothetical protein [candidate division Zixibacteria bacterium]